DTDILLRAGEQAQKIVLDAVSVLIFVNVNVLKAALPLFANGSGIAKEFRGAQEQVVEVERFALRQDFFVLCVNVGGVASVGSERFAAQGLRRFSVVFGEADLAEDRARLQFVIFEIESADG